MIDNNEYCDIQLELTDDMWRYYENSPKIEVIKKQQEKNKEKLLLLLSLLATLTGLEKTKKLKEINSIVDSIFKSEKLLESEYLYNILYELTKYSYDVNNYVMKLGDKTFSSSKLNEKDINNIINEKIENKTNKDRISNNKDELKDKVIKNIALLGTVITISQLKKKIEDIYENNLDTTKTMFENEIHRCTDRAYNKWNKDNNIKNVMYVSRLETNTCEECKGNHGKIFKTGQEIELPIHVHCKCFYSVIPNNNWFNNFGKVTFKNLKKWSDKNNER